MKSLNEQILQNLLIEREMAYAKKSANTQADLPVDRIDRRIAVLNAAIDEHHRMILEEAKKVL